MLNQSQACERVTALVDRVRKLGADSADAIYIGEESEAIQIRLGKLEDVERSEGEHIGLRVFIGRQSASIGSSDFADSALDELASRAVTMARAAPEDPYAGLAPRDLLAKDWATDLDLDDPHDLTPEDLRSMAMEAEDAARAVPDVTNSEGASASAGRHTLALATSHGFAGAYSASSRSISASVIAGNGQAMQRDYAWRQTRHRADLPSPSSIGTLAGERAAARLNPGQLASGSVPVVLDPRVSSSLLGHLIGAMAGPAIARKSSFLLDRLNEELFDPSILIIEEPHKPRGLASRPFDGEGLPTIKRNLVENGRITGWLLNSASARQLNLPLTGHASRGHGGAPGVTVSNVHLATGQDSPETLIADIADGVYITELIGHGVNGVTGDYSRGASGFRICNGEITTPVAQFTIAGNLLAMFRAMTPANDLEWQYAINAPTIRIDGMTIAGN